MRPPQDLPEDFYIPMALDAPNLTALSPFAVPQTHLGSPGVFRGMAAFMFVLIALGAPINALTIFCTARYKKLRSHLNYILVNLAVSNLLVICVGSTTAFYSFSQMYFALGPTACKIEGFAATLGGSGGAGAVGRGDVGTLGWMWGHGDVGTLGCWDGTRGRWDMRTLQYGTWGRWDGWWDMGTDVGMDIGTLGWTWGHWDTGTLGHEDVGTLGWTLGCGMLGHGDIGTWDRTRGCWDMGTLQHGTLGQMLGWTLGRGTLGHGDVGMDVGTRGHGDNGTWDGTRGCWDMGTLQYGMWGRWDGHWDVGLDMGTLGWALGWTWGHGDTGIWGCGDTGLWGHGAVGLWGRGDRDPQEVSVPPPQAW